MTGSRFQLRRYGGCNLYWRAPTFGLRRDRSHTPPPRGFRIKLYILEEHYYPNSRRYGRDRLGPFVYLWPDCTWQWLATRPLLRLTPLYRLDEHVHTRHDNPDRHYVFLPLGRFLVRLSHSTALDTRLETDVFPDSTEYVIQVRFPYLTLEQTTALMRAIGPSSQFSATDGVFAHRAAPYSQATWRVRASNPSLAREKAFEQVRQANLLGGSSWETPRPVYNTKN